MTLPDHRTRWAALSAVLVFVGVAALAFLGVAALGSAMPAHAAPAGSRGLGVALETTDPARPVLVLTNRDSAPCQVVAGALGTVTLTAVTQDGAAVMPIGAEGSPGEGLPYILTGQLRSLAPGESIQVPLPVLEWGPTGHALQTVAWSPKAGAFAALYPTHTDRPLTLSATYLAPPLATTGAPLCTAPLGSSVDSAAAAGASATRSVTLWVAIGVAVLLLIAVLAVLMWRRRKASRASRTGSAAALMLIAMLIGIGWQGRPAYATIVATPGLASAWAACSQLLHQPGHDPDNILPTLDDPKIKVEITPGTPNGTDYGNGEYGISKTHMLIQWNLQDFHKYYGTGGTADPCDSLYHELYHAFEHAKGTYDHNNCITADGDTGIPIAEVNATRAQNRLRVKLGREKRSHYGNLTLPDGACLPPPADDTCHDPAYDKQKHPAPIRAGEYSTMSAAASSARADLRAGPRDGCGDSNGDPHLRTLDGRRYDFQAVGEFVLTADPGSGSGFEVQVRQQPTMGLRTVSVNTAVAMTVGADRVQVDLSPEGTLRLLVGGVARPVGAMSLPGGGALAMTPRGGVVVIWPDNSRTTVTAIGVWGLRVSPEPSKAHDGKLIGLLGDLDGVPGNDIKVRGGATITDPRFETLFPGYADSWRVDATSSLFTYDAGKTTASYTDRSFPDRPAAIDGLANRSAAEAVCRAFGVSDPEVFVGCVLDVALTGQPDFAAAAGAGQAFVAGGTVGGLPWTAQITAAGETASFSFDASAGQRVFIDVPSSTLPDQCSVIMLRAPDKSLLNSGCVISGKGYIDGTLLPATGTYTIVVDPAGAAVGEARMSVILSRDNAGTITVDGPQSTATETTPGQLTRITFASTANQKVFLDVTASTLPDQCGVITLRAPDGAVLNSGCIIGGLGYIDGTVLPATGEYSLTVDPAVRDTGQATLRLTSATDQIGTITINGPEVVASIQQAGAIASFTFAGVAGQKVVLDIPSSTLPDQCGVLAVRAPDHSTIVTTCIIGGKGAEPGIVLPATGTYTLILDPAERHTGQARLRLHT